jgi:membrane-bound metal-dependent hydrolase YbcI (DUF457 family)
MYPVAHATIAVGAVKAGEGLFPRSWLPLDYRFAALGALLPDLIDKPPAYFLSVGDPHGHTFAHTLVFALTVIVGGVLIANRSGDSRLLVVGLGWLSHLLVDPVVVYPVTLLWPLFGFEFANSMGIKSSYLRIIDAVMIALAMVALARSRALRNRALAFVSTGTV